MMKSLSRSVSKSTKKLMKSKHLFLIILLVVLAGFVLYNLYKNGNLELFSGGAKLYFFFADWCGYCKQFKPEWEKLKNESNLGVQLEEVDCTDNNNTPALAKEYNVRGFPTLIFVSGNNKVTYQGQRNKDSLVSFIKDNL